jgi:hypothetical protein
MRKKRICDFLCFTVFYVNKNKKKSEILNNDGSVYCRELSNVVLDMNVITKPNLDTQNTAIRRF